MTIGNVGPITFGDLSKINQSAFIDISGFSPDIDGTDFEVLNKTNYPNLVFNVIGNDFVTFDENTGVVTVLKKGLLITFFTFNVETTSPAAIVVASIEVDSGSGFVRGASREQSLSKAGIEQKVSSLVIPSNIGDKWRVVFFAALNDVNLITVVNAGPPAYTVLAGSIDVAFLQR